MKKRFPHRETTSTLVPMTMETSKFALGRNPVVLESRTLPPTSSRRTPLPAPPQGEVKVPPKGSSFLLTDPYPLPHVLSLLLLP
jgi:hypothetical protein